jgi:pyruvate dehydrogenase E1 component beta subunit
MYVSEEAADELEKYGISVELIDLRSIKPYDKNLIAETIKRTGRVVIVDGSWKTGGFSAEISAFISENLFNYLKSPVIRICLPDSPAPASSTLEKNYYISSSRIFDAVKRLFSTKKSVL